MNKLIDASKLFFCVSAAAFVMGCGTTATISRPPMREVEAKIISSDSEYIYVESGTGTTSISRGSITEIDHPGNVAATIGAVVTGYGIANIAAGASDCDRGGAAYCTGVFLPAMIGAPIMAYGLVTWARSLSAAGDTKKKTEPTLAVVPTVSVDKKNEYVGVSAAMRF